MPIALLALTISAFAIGTTEFVIVGLIPLISQQLGVTVPSAGLLVSIYALGVAIGAPVLTALTAKVKRKQLLIGLMVLFTLGNLVAWQSPNYQTLVVARLLTGLAHGVFFSIGSTIATGLVSKEKAATAIALMFGGLTVALVTGVPLGTFIGQHFGWRETFLAVSLIGVVAIITSMILIPNNIKNNPVAKMSEQAKVLMNPRLLLIYAITALGYGGVFTIFTFLAPMMQIQAGFSANMVSWILLAYGVSVAIGNVWGGKLADKYGAVKALSMIFVALSALLFVFQFTSNMSIPALITLLVMGVFAFGNVPGLQVYVVQKAEELTPNAVDVASGLNIAAFNVGIALGSIIGGQVVANIGLLQTPWIGAVIVFVALLLIRLSGYLDKQERTHHTKNQLPYLIKI